MEYIVFIFLTILFLGSLILLSSLGSYSVFIHNSVKYSVNI